MPPSFNIYYYYMLLPTARLITAHISMIPAPEDYRETPAVKLNSFSFYSFFFFHNGKWNISRVKTQRILFL